MSSKVIIPAYTHIVQQQLIPALPEYWHHQVRFGVQALTIKPFVSLASNARATIANPNTASTNMDRLVGNAGLAREFSPKPIGWPREIYIMLRKGRVGLKQIHNCFSVGDASGGHLRLRLFMNHKATVLLQSHYDSSKRIDPPCNR